MTARTSIGSIAQRARLRTHSARRDAPVEPTVALVGLLVLTVAAMALAVGEVGWFPLSFFMLPLVLGGLLLRRLQINHGKRMGKLGLT